MSLSKIRVLQAIREGKRELDIENVAFEVKYDEKPDISEKRAEIFIWSKNQAEIMLYPNATFFSVRHELCHTKLFKMGFPLTNTEGDLKLFPNLDDLKRMIAIAEWYINELQKQVFREYYAVDETGKPRPPPFPGLPSLPKEKFTAEQIKQISEIAKKKNNRESS